MRTLERLHEARAPAPERCLHRGVKATLNTNGQTMPHPLRIAVFQRRLAEFRIPIFARLAREPGIALRVVVAEAPKDSRELRFDCLELARRSLPIGGFLLQRGFVKEAARHDVALVEGSTRFLTSVGLVLTKRLHGATPVWWTSLHDPKAGTVAFPAGVKGLVLRQLLRRVGAVAAYSETAAALVRANMPFARVVVAPNVLDTDVLAQAEAEWTGNRERLPQFARESGIFGRRVILFVGRLIPPKRLDDLLLTFERLRCRRPDLNPLLAIVGDGPERRRLDALARTLGLSEDVKWFGEIRAMHNVCPIFLSAKVFVLPGAGGLGLYQALAHGLPVVATHADGTERDLIRDGETGFLCRPGDVAALTARVEAILELDSSAWSDFSTTCRRVAREELHVRRMVRSLVQAAEEAAGVRLAAGVAGGAAWSGPAPQGVAP